MLWKRQKVWESISWYLVHCTVLTLESLDRAHSQSIMKSTLVTTWFEEEKKLCTKMNKLVSTQKIYTYSTFKVHIFWEGHKSLRNLHLLLSVCTVDKSKVDILQNFVAFSEWTNFNICAIKKYLHENKFCGHNIDKGLLKF